MSVNRATPIKSTRAPKYQGTIDIAPPPKLRLGRTEPCKQQKAPEIHGNDRHRPPHEAEIRPAWHVHARYEPLDVPYQSPRGRDDEDETDQEHEAAPDEVPNSEIDRERPVAVP